MALSVSCPSAGNCGTGGYYTNRSGRQAFVASETNGTWLVAKKVPGTAALNAAGNAVIASVSCGSAGNCSAGGYYTDGSGHEQAFVAGQSAGTWRTATEVPGTATLNTDGTAAIASLSCPSAGNCSGGGYYIDGAAHEQAFVAQETSGTWRTAKKVPGLAPLNEGGNAIINSVSCASAGNCSAAGESTGGSGTGIAFVVSEKTGTWGTAQEILGMAVLGPKGAGTVAVSCGSAGNCGAGGYYIDETGSQQAFVVRENKGVWGTAKEVPGTAALNTGRSAALATVSCASANNCSAGGFYTDVHTGRQAFVVSETSSG